jgi:hypothetical protein
MTQPSIAWKSVFVVIMLAGLSGVVHAQTYKPGDKITLKVTFEGKDASRITYVSMSIRTGGDLPTQPNFATDLGTSDFKSVGPNTFEATFVVPDNQASGDYQLVEIQARIDQLVTLHYSQTEYPERHFKIENSKTIEKPKIKSLSGL